MFADHEALRVQVNDGDEAAPAGQFGRETHVAQADLKTIAFRLDACERESREVQKIDGRGTRDRIL